MALTIITTIPSVKMVAVMLHPNVCMILTIDAGHGILPILVTIVMEWPIEFKMIAINNNPQRRIVAPSSEILALISQEF